MRESVQDTGMIPRPNPPPYPPVRWVIAVMGTLLQLCLGTVYAWSFFQKTLMESYGWSNAQVSATFSLAIAALGLSAAWGGLQLPRHGPRFLAMAGGAMFGMGYLLAALALHWRWLPLLHLGYGVVGGIGLGLGYVTPVATVARWFPDRKGLLTGLVVMGFGFGALLLSKVIAPLLMSATGGNVAHVFAFLGIGFGVITMAAAAFLRNPPETTPAASPGAVPAGPATPPASTGSDLRSTRFATMWLIFFCNIFAGISIIGFQSPLFQDLWQRAQPTLSRDTLVAYGATLIAVSSLFNGVGRLFWGGLSDRLGRVQVFRLMLITQIAAFIVLALTGNPWIFAGLVCYVLLCYGGGFGTMPSFVLDVFGAPRMATVYGAILTAWSAAGILGPQVMAWLKDHFPAQATPYAFTVAAAMLAFGGALSLRFAGPPDNN